MLLMIFCMVFAGLTTYTIFRRFCSKKQSYQDQKVLILGGSSGLGLALAKELTKKGANVTVTSRSQDKIEKLQEKHGFSVLQTDITDDQAVNALPIEYNIIFCCPGIAIPCLINDITINQIHECMETNFYGAVRVFMHYIKEVTPQKRKKLVLISSTLALHSFIGYAAYSPSKASLRSFYESVKKEAELQGLDMFIYYCSTINSPGLEREDRTKPEITKRIEGQTHGASANPDKRAKKLLDSISYSRSSIIFSDTITQFFFHSVLIYSVFDFFVWATAPIFWILFRRKVSTSFSACYKLSTSKSSTS